MADVIVTNSGGTGTLTYYDTDICNMALGRIGNADNYVTSVTLGNSGTKEARLCNLYYKQVLRMALLALSWKHAILREELTVDDEVDPSTGYDYQYSLPDDCLIVIDISDVEGQANKDFKWIREGRYILCNIETSIYITYVPSNNTSSDYDTHFINYLVAALALELAPSLVVNENVLARLEKDKAVAYMQALSIERREGWVEDSKPRWEEFGRVSTSNMWDPAVHD
jgi:hypothetical protein